MSAPTLSSAATTAASEQIEGVEVRERDEYSVVVTSYPDRIACAVVRDCRVTRRRAFPRVAPTS